jgi:hypothetical protein
MAPRSASEKELLFVGLWVRKVTGCLKFFFFTSICDLFCQVCIWLDKLQNVWQFRCDLFYYIRKFFENIVIDARHGTEKRKTQVRDEFLLSEIFLDIAFLTCGTTRTRNRKWTREGNRGKILAARKRLQIAKTIVSGHAFTFLARLVDSSREQK